MVRLGDEARGQGSAEESRQDAGLIDALQRLIGSGAELGRLHIDRKLAETRAALMRAAMTVALGVLGLVAAILALASLVSGLAGGMGALVGSPWAGDLIAGALVIALLGATAHLLRQRTGRRRLARIRRRHGDLPAEDNP